MTAREASDAAGFGDIARRIRRLVTQVAELDLHITAAHAAEDHHSPGSTRQLMRVRRPAVRSVLPEARRATTRDLLNTTKALPIRER
jgi:hypothetical protein